MFCPILLIISLDGFRYDYLNYFGWENFPNFLKVLNHGLVTHHMNNLFITKTFPNHFSMVTGVFEEIHGIIHNYMYDVKYSEFFYPWTKDSKWWDNGAEPIWITNQKSAFINKNCSYKTNIAMWPGSESIIKNMTPTYFMKYSNQVSLRDKINKVIPSFTKGVNLGLIYHNEPDKQGHWYGPHSSQVFEKIKELDKDIEFLINEIYNKLYLNNYFLNVIITSDHGMTSLKENMVIYLSDIFVTTSKVVIAGNSPTYNIFVKDGNILQSLQKELIPKRWHYQANRRIGDILIVGQPGWNILRSRKDKIDKGTHGFDNEFPQSWPIFMMFGPMFLRGNRFDGQPTINLIDVYALICHTLAINPAPNNGSINNVKHLLASFQEQSNYDPSWMLTPVLNSGTNIFQILSLFILSFNIIINTLIAISFLS